MNQNEIEYYNAVMSQAELRWPDASYIEGMIDMLAFPYAETGKHIQLITDLAFLIEICWILDDMRAEELEHAWQKLTRDSFEKHKRDFSHQSLSGLF